LCNSHWCADVAKVNPFDIYMLSNQRVRVIKEKIVDRHGRIENVRLFRNEPSDEQLSMKQMKEEPKEDD